MHISKSTVIILVLVALYILRLVVRKNDDVFVQKIYEAHKHAVSEYQIVVAEEPNSKKGFFTIKGKLLHQCTAVDCTQTKSSSYIQLRISELSVNKFRAIEIGDLIKVSGIIRPTIHQLSNTLRAETEQNVDYENYLKKERIFYEISSPKILDIIHGHTFSLVKYLVRLRKLLEHKIATQIPSPEGDLAQGLVISGKGSMSTELLTDFQRVGLIHIVVLSGSNVSIISAALFSILSKLPHMVTSILGILGMTAFALMTGGSPPVVRSVLLTSIPLIFGLNSTNKDARRSTLFTEKFSTVSLLFITGLLMSIHNPLLPIYDISFQLSFMATLGLMTFTTPLSEIMSFVPKRFMIREIVSSSVATQIFVTPLLLHISGSLSTVFLVANIIVLPLLPIIMFLIFLTLLACFIQLQIAGLLGSVSWLVLHAIISFVQSLAKPEFAMIHIAELSRKDLIITYIVLIPILFVIKKLFEYRAKTLHQNIAAKSSGAAPPP